MRRLMLLVVLTTLAVAPPASAKEIVSVHACGPDSCVTSEDDSLRAVLMHGGTRGVPRGDRARSIALKATSGNRQTGEEFGSFMAAWVPEWGILIIEDGDWMRVPVGAALTLRRLTDQVGTFPPRELHRLPPAERELPVAPAADSGAGVGWLLGLAAAVAALTLGAVLLLARRRPRGGPRAATP
jgi:hypothetical protein